MFCGFLLNFFFQIFFQHKKYEIPPCAHFYCVAHRSTTIIIIIISGCTRIQSAENKYIICLFVYQFADAYQHVKENLSELNGKAGANETDLVFLRGLLDSPAVTQLIKVRK